ncbi:MAG: nucleotidyltransferase [Deltaproteobacteria bacterium]|nr:nucleotidyltransferase [Deltaproteobacteria bacterium]
MSLEALGRHGFRTEKTDVNWLFKAFKEEILVDIIFKSRGEIYFDNEMADRSRRIEFHGRKVRAVAPEDLIIIKCAVHDEIGPHHWHDALAVLSHAEVDWPYLLKRGRRASRRLLALLTYAQSSDIWVPNWVIFELFRLNYGEKQQDEKSQAREPWAPPSVPMQQQVQRPEGIQRAPSSQYVAARVREAMARDPRGGDQDIKILVEGNRLLLRGEVTSDEHRRALEAVARDAAGGYRVESQLKVAVLSRPEGAEEVG